MSHLRDKKRMMRRDRHAELAIAALYIAATGAIPVACSARLWSKTEQQSAEMPGLTGAAAMATPEDRIRFLLSEFAAPLRAKAIVSVEAGEAYRIDHLYPADDGFQTARVVRLTAAEAAGLPVPA